MKTSKLLAFLMFAISILTFSACSVEDNNQDGSLIVDDVSYEYEGYISQGHTGIYLEIYITNGKELTLVIPSKEIDELNVGDIIDLDEFYVRNYGSSLDQDYDETGGTLYIMDKKEQSITIKIEDLTIENGKGVQHKIKGLITLSITGE